MARWIVWGGQSVKADEIAYAEVFTNDKGIYLHHKHDRELSVFRRDDLFENHPLVMRDVYARLVEFLDDESHAVIDLDLEASIASERCEASGIDGTAEDEIADPLEERVAEMEKKWLFLERWLETNYRIKWDDEPDEKPKKKRHRFGK